MDYQSFQPDSQEQNQIPVESPVTPPSMEPMPQKTFTPKFIGVIVLLLVLGVGAYGAIWYWQKQQATQEVVLTFTPRPIATPDPTTDWKTYTNTQYGFEFKLPQGWIQNKEPNISKENILINFASPEAQKGPKFDFYGGELNVWIYQNPKSFSVTKFFDGNNGGNELFHDPDGGLVKTKDIIVDSRSGKRFYDVVGGSTAQIAVIDDHSRFIEIDDGFSLEILDQILSTFKFIDSNLQSGYGILAGYVTIGPNCPVEREGVLCTPAPEAYTSRQVTVYKADGATLVTTQNFDTQGNYNIYLPVGTYVVKSKTGMGSIYNVVGTVTIKSGQISTLNFNIDTGIR